MLKLTKRSVFLVVALMLVMVFTLSACSGKGENVLRIGVDDSYPPMEFKDDAGKMVGFDVDMATEIGKRLNMKVEFVSTAWSGIFLALESEKYDCIISSLSITEERKKSIAFTKPYIANTQAIVVKADNNNITAPADLKDKIVGVQMGTTSDEACVKFNEQYPFKDFQKYEAIIEPFASLKANRLDAVVVDLVVGKYYVAKDKETYKMLGAGLPNEPIGIGFKLENSDLRDKIDKALDEMRADGTLKQISEKWFGEDLTSNIEE